MSDNQQFDQILNILTGFIERQEAFNAKQEAFNAKQEAFNAKQEAFNAKQELFNSTQLWTNHRLEVSIDGLRRDLGEFRHQEELNHNATHRLIMQAFEHINDLKSDRDGKTWVK
jgi:hypothetical protein